MTSIHQNLETILGQYRAARNGPFGSSQPIYQVFKELERALAERGPIQRRPYIRVEASPGKGNWARVPWIALLNRDETKSTQEGVYVVFLFREDMSGVYLTFNQGVKGLEKMHGIVPSRQILRERAKQLHDLVPSNTGRSFEPGEWIDLRTQGQLGTSYEFSTASFVLYEQGQLPQDEELDADLEVLLAAYDAYMASALRREFRQASPDPELEPDVVIATTTTANGAPPATEFDLHRATEELLDYISKQGFVFEPWQVAQYITALRTKPFVILAGITGTGKSKLPRLVAQATGGDSELIPVRPDWTDSSEILGYIDLSGAFRPGRILEIAYNASVEEDVHHTLIIDEMNLARVEHYFAEVLSRIEDRRRREQGGWASSPLVRMPLSPEFAEWGKVRIPPNLALVGTVNMDESAHGFSRKVLDRAFTLELSEVDLASWAAGQGAEVGVAGEVTTWPVHAWLPRATRLSELGNVSPEESDSINGAITELTALNKVLTPAQLQVGYRTRDEVALFLLHAQEIEIHFRTAAGEPVDPMDLAVQMKVLPRIAGGSGAIRRVLQGMLGWSDSGLNIDNDDAARDVVDRWESAGRPSRLAGARFPGTAARICLMWDRLETEGFTSYWL